MTTIRAESANKPATTASIHAAALRDIEPPCTKNMARELQKAASYAPSQLEPGASQVAASPKSSAPSRVVAAACAADGRVRWPVLSLFVGLLPTGHSIASKPVVLRNLGGSEQSRLLNVRLQVRVPHVALQPPNARQRIP
jgi:hypothetical protein